MSRRSKVAESPLSLFTFLDGLMCTMGALILVLVAMSGRIREVSLAQALEQLTHGAAAGSELEPPLPEEPADIPAPPSAEEEQERSRARAARAAESERRRAEWDRLLAEAFAARERGKQALDQRRRALLEAERALRAAQSRLLAARDDAETAQRAQAEAAAAEARLTAQEEQVALQIADTRRQLDLAERKQASRPNEFALVPYDGTSGTLRRPIYIECTGRGFRFVPEGEFIGPEHLDGFRESFNPLLAGAQALLRHWNASRRASGGDEPEPYILLIVRPSGSLSYYLARKLLAPVNAHFGYELVEEDWKLATPDPDPQARAVLRDAIDVTLEAQRKVRESLAGAGGDRSGRLAFNHRDLSRSLAEDSASGRGDDDPAGGAERAHPGGAAPGGGRSGRGSLAERGAARPVRPFGADDEPGVAGGTGGDRGERMARSADHGGSNRDGGESVAGDAADGRGGQPESRRAGRTGRPGRARPANISGFDDPADGPDESDDPWAEDGATADDREGSHSGDRGSGGVSRRRSPGQGADEPPFFPLPEEMQPSRGNLPRARAGDRGGQTGRLRTLEPERGDQGTGAEGTTRGRGRDRRAAAEAGPDGAVEGGAPLVPPASPGAPPGLGAPGGNGPEGEQTPVLSFGSSAGGGEESRDPWQPGKKQFGRPGRRAGIGLERKVEIHARKDRLLIGPHDATIGVSPGDKTDDLVKKVLSGIEQSAQSWGAPPANFYWLPAVRFVVYPGGNGHYERLRGPLQKWGIVSSVQYLSSEPAADGSGGPRR